MGAVDLLATDKPLPRRYVDHQLTGESPGSQGLHIRPDLLLVYRLPDADKIGAVFSPVPNEIHAITFTLCIYADTLRKGTPRN